MKGLDKFFSKNMKKQDTEDTMKIPRNIGSLIDKTVMEIFEGSKTVTSSRILSQ